MSNESFQTNEPPTVKRYEEYFIQSYIRKNEMLKYLETLRTVGGVLEYYAFIEHDQDVFSSDDESVKNGRVNAGDRKKSHNHCVLKFFSGRSKTPTAVQKMFDRAKFTDDNGKFVSLHYCEPCLNRTRAIAYLTHSDEKSKLKHSFEYPVSDIVYSSEDAKLFFSSVKKSHNAESDISANILLDMLDGVTLRDLAKMYGRDFIYHYHVYRDLCKDIRLQESYRSKL